MWRRRCLPRNYIWAPQCAAGSGRICDVTLTQLAVWQCCLGMSGNRRCRHYGDAPDSSPQHRAAAPLPPPTTTTHTAAPQVCYGVVIVTFLGAVHWGVAMATPLTSPIAVRLANEAFVYSVLPSLVAWPVALMDPGGWVAPVNKPGATSSQRACHGCVWRRVRACVRAPLPRASEDAGGPARQVLMLALTTCGCACMWWQQSGQAFAQNIVALPCVCGAWVSSAGAGSLCLSLLLPGCYMADYTRRNLGLPAWYMTLRVPLTVLATFGMLLTATRSVYLWSDSIAEVQRREQEAVS